MLSPGEGDGTPLQYSCLETPMDRGAWWAAVRGSRRVGHDWVTSLSLFTFVHWRRKWQPLQCSCLENPRDGGAWWAAVSGVAQSRPRLTRLSSSSSSSRTLLRLWWPSVLAYRGKGLAVLCLISSCFGDNLENQHLITLCLPLDCDSLYPVYHVPLNSLLLLPIVGSYV